MKVLIFGGTGLLGSDIKKVCDASGKSVKPLDSKAADITDLEIVINKVKAESPDVVINCAALTDVDACERDPDKAFKVNAIGPKNIAIACRQMNIKMIHVSTDYVFDGEAGRPYTEFEKVNPVNQYGKSKVAGEDFVKAIMNDFIIIRTAWIFGEKRNHFVDYVVNGLKSGTEIIAVRDMVSSPTYSLDLAELINSLLDTNETGIFHGCNKGYCSRVEMVEEIMKIMNKPGHVKVMNQSQWKRDAKRPVFSALKNYHLDLIDKDIMAGWRDALKRYIRNKIEKNL